MDKHAAMITHVVVLELDVVFVVDFWIHKTEKGKILRN
ncbi:hypothetical protein Mgra_00003838 [Meloidogyne graminicola]|uniref:Uncharacterized protein n=1 Tax=Meloidogyne graminicola TaxID=189291 RepID=A0A8S9ZTS4_9BILA|nr:hypothetical protein Mgra_00003838 [Meloidogyne graminicola]